MTAAIRINHDAKPGLLERCQISGSTDLHEVIDLGHQPPCDALLTAAQLNEPERTYPLRLMLCPQSGLAQLDYVVPGDEIYPPSYPYRSGISKPLAVYQRSFADGVVRRFDLGKGSVVVDVGCNDGTLLTGFMRNGCRAVGVEPTDVAKIAREENCVEVRQAFFTEALAREIVSEDGPAKLVTMTNVFAHMADLGEVMRGLVALLDSDGVFITESHYLLDVLDKKQFDTVYHEHIRTYSLKALVTLFEQYGMEVFDVERAERYGGNIRAYVGIRGRHQVSAAVGELLRLEEVRGLHDPATWRMWRERVLAERDVFMEWLFKTRRAGRKVVGKSSPGRAATLINFYGIKPDQIPYLAELPDSLKLGKFVPGAHIPIVDERCLVREQPDDVVLFAWHYGAVIAQRLRDEGLKARLVLPLPQFRLMQ